MPTIYNEDGTTTQLTPQQWQEAIQRVQHSIQIQNEQQHVAQTLAERNRNATNAAILKADARGEEHFGTESWKGSMQRLSRDSQLDLHGISDLVATVAPKTGHLFAAELANDPDLKRQFVNASDNRRVEMVRQHARNRSSFGIVEDDTPPPQDDHEFLKTGGRGVADDREFSKQWDRAMRDRGHRR
jgi:hypothetical protein